MLSSLLALRVTVPILIILLCSACASVPGGVVPMPQEATWEQKLGWIMRLEDQRTLRDPDSAALTLADQSENRPAIVASRTPSDLLLLFEDPEARVRRRAALAAGRVGLPEALDGLVGLLRDAEMEVRQMAAFALGLIGDPAARLPLHGALADEHPMVRGRAAEALAALGATADASAIGVMVRAEIDRGVLVGLDADAMSDSSTPETEAVRLGLAALGQLRDHDALSLAVTTAADGMPVSNWWPVAAALQRAGDKRSEATLLALLASRGRFTALFAARGLGGLRSVAAVQPLIGVARDRTVPIVVAVESVRALAAIGDERSAALMLEIATDSDLDLRLRLAALSAVGAVHPPGVIEVLLDLLSEPAALVRAAAMRALGRLDPDTLMLALSGLGPDPDWMVRASQATLLGTLREEQATPRLMQMLEDPDPRVVGAVLGALVEVRAPEVEQILSERLSTDDVAVRSAAADGLGEIGSPAALPVLAAAYREWRDEPSWVERAAVISAMAAIDSSAAQPVLRDALQDRDWAVRRVAADLLTGQGRADVEAAIRPAPAGREISASVWQWLQAPQFSPHAIIETDEGAIEIELAVLDAPLTVAAFMDLAERGFFNGTPWQRSEPGGMLVGGDSRGDGLGGPGYTVRDEVSLRPVVPGAVGIMSDREDSGGGRFFVAHSPYPEFNGRRTVFGHVVDGMDVIERLAPTDLIRRITVWGGMAAE